MCKYCEEIRYIYVDKDRARATFPRDSNDYYLMYSSNCKWGEDKNCPHCGRTLEDLDIRFEVDYESDNLSLKKSEYHAGENYDFTHLHFCDSEDYSYLYYPLEDKWGRPGVYGWLERTAPKVKWNMKPTWIVDGRIYR